jgi:hypothetical protein
MKSDFDTFPCIRLLNMIDMSNNFLLEHTLSNSNRKDNCNTCTDCLRNYTHLFHTRIYNHTFIRCIIHYIILFFSLFVLYTKYIKQINLNYKNE